MDADPATLAEEIEKFIREQENTQNVPDPEQPTPPSSRNPRIPPPRPSPHTQQRTTVKVNYNGSHITFEVSAAPPSEIKNRFNIQAGTLELNRRGTIYKENDDDEFEPPLVVGTYNLTVIEPRAQKKHPVSSNPRKPKKNVSIEEQEMENENEVTFYSFNHPTTVVDIEADGKVELQEIDIFISKNDWRSAYLVNENTGDLKSITDDTTWIRSERGTKYGILFYSEETDRRQMASLKNRNAVMSRDTSAKSLSEVSMARATVFWIAFPRIFYALSKIDEDLQLQNDISKYDALICPGSLKASLFQMAYSIKEFMKAQVFNAAFLFKARKMRPSHYTKSLSNLNKMKAEVNEFIKALVEYLREHQQTEATVTLVSQVKDLDHLDKKIMNEQSEYEKGKSLEDLMKIKTSTIFADDESGFNDLKQFTMQRSILNDIFKSVEEMISGHNFDIPKILNLLKCLKELICAEIIHFLHADAVSKCSEPDADEELHLIKEHHKNLYELWRLIGAAFPQITNLEQRSHKWKSFTKEILEAQHVAEASFHEILNRPPQRN